MMRGKPDLDTRLRPISIRLSVMKLTGAEKDSFILESVTGGEVRGRYSIIDEARPDLALPWDRSRTEQASRLRYGFCGRGR